MLEANLHHWNRAARGPRVQRAVFRNTLSPSQALDLCLGGDGEVDIVTEVDPSDAARVEASEHARLVVADADRVLCCIVDRARADVPLDSGDVRTALNLAVDRAPVRRVLKATFETSGALNVAFRTTPGPPRRLGA